MKTTGSLILLLISSILFFLAQKWQPIAQDLVCSWRRLSVKELVNMIEKNDGALGKQIDVYDIPAICCNQQ